jgi:hypothetical protein
MKTGLTMTHLQDIFTFPFRDPQWKKKMGLGALFLFLGYIIPILPGFFFSGYCYRMMRRIIINREDRALPEWEDWGGLFTDGAKVTLVYFVAFLPSIMLMVGSYLVMISPTFFIALNEEFIPSFLLMFLGYPGIAMGVALSLIAQAFIPVAICHMAAKDKLSAAFQIGGWWRVLRANLVGFLLSFLIVMGVSMLAGFFVQLFYWTIVLCCLLPLIGSAISVYTVLTSSALYANTYSEGAASLE